MNLPHLVCDELSDEAAVYVAELLNGLAAAFDSQHLGQIANRTEPLASGSLKPEEDFTYHTVQFSGSISFCATTTNSEKPKSNARATTSNSTSSKKTTANRTEPLASAATH